MVQRRWERVDYQLFLVLDVVQQYYFVLASHARSLLRVPQQLDLLLGELVRVALGAELCLALPVRVVAEVALLHLLEVHHFLLVLLIARQELVEVPKEVQVDLGILFEAFGGGEDRSDFILCPLAYGRFPLLLLPLGLSRRQIDDL